jgi:flavin reductase (DIM6/NTAB) family NADH-FMN oxidoreductase RutF
MNISCAPAPPEVDEFNLAGLTRAPSRLIAAPRVGESPVNFECRMTQTLQLGHMADPGRGGGCPYRRGAHYRRRL